MTRRHTIAGLILSILACHASEGEPLGHQIDDAERHVAELQQEIEMHASLAGQVANLQMLQQSESTHAAASGEHVMELGHAMGDMGECQGAAVGLIDSMMEVHEMCEGELRRHRDAIEVAGDLDEALEEEDRHRREMMDRFDELDAMLGDMMNGHGMTMCTGHHGMDDHDNP